VCGVVPRDVQPDSFRLENAISSTPASRTKSLAAAKRRILALCSSPKHSMPQASATMPGNELTMGKATTMESTLFASSQAACVMPHLMPDAMTGRTMFRGVKLCRPRK